MTFPTAHLSNEFARSSNEVAAGLTVEQQHKEAQEREMDRANLTGAGEFAARGGSSSVAGAKLEEEKKKKNSEKLHLNTMLEQQRQQMLDRINSQIGKLSKEIEQDQEKLDSLQKRSTAFGKVKKLVQADQINQKTPHNDLLDEAGIQNKNKFINASKEDKLDYVDKEQTILVDKMGGLVEKIDANMDKLAVLADAKEKLENGADPKQITADLKEKGIALEVETSADRSVSAENTIFAIEDVEYAVGKDKKILENQVQKVRADEQPSEISLNTPGFN